MHLVLHLLRLVRALAADRTRLALENLALRQQLTVLQRSVERPKLNDADRAFWTMACEFLESWKDHLVIVKPETVNRANLGAIPGSRACSGAATEPGTVSHGYALGVVRGLLFVAALALVALIFMLASGARSRTERHDGARAVGRNPENPTAEAAVDRSASAAPKPATGRPAESKRPDESEESNRIAFRVRVVTGRRTPASGATVRVYDQQNEHLGTQEADAEGTATFEVPLENYLSVLAQRGDLASVTVNAHVTATAPMLEVRLQPTFPAPFVALDREGEPIAHAEILCSFTGPIQGSHTPTAIIFTDERGEARMLDQQLGRRPYFRIHKQGYRYRYCEVDREDLMRHGAEVRLERVAAVVGRVVDLSGRGVEGVDVVVAETMDFAKSDPEGRFSLDCLGESGGRLLFRPNPPLGEQVVEHGIPRGGRVDVGKIVLRPGKAIRGTARRLDGGSVLGTQLDARAEALGIGVRIAEVTSLDGTFEITGLREGTYRICAFRSGETVSADLEAVPAGAKGVDLVLRMRPRLRLALVSERTGKPVWVLRFAARVRPLAGGATRTVRHESMRLRRSAGADLRVDLPGKYEVVVEADDYPVQTRVVEVGEKGAEFKFAVPE